MTPVPEPHDWEVIDLHRMVDGDTFDLEVRRVIGILEPFTIEAHGVIRIRSVHLDTPERGEPGYHEATNDAESWLIDGLDINGGLRLTTQGTDVFGRYLGDVYLASDRSKTLSDYMVREKDWPVWIG